MPDRNNPAALSDSDVLWKFSSGINPRALLLFVDFAPSSFSFFFVPLNYWNSGITGFYASDPPLVSYLIYIHVRFISPFHNPSAKVLIYSYPVQVRGIMARAIYFLWSWWCFLIRQANDLPRGKSDNWLHPSDRHFGIYRVHGEILFICSQYSTISKIDRDTDWRSFSVIPLESYCCCHRRHEVWHHQNCVGNQTALHLARDLES